MVTENRNFGLRVRAKDAEAAEEAALGDDGAGEIVETVSTTDEDTQSRDVNSVEQED